MLHKTRGIVFKSTDFAESSVIVQVFTEKFGLQSYLINGVKKPKAKIRKNVLQPLHLLEMVVYHKLNGNIQRVAEIRHIPVFQTIPYDIIKSSVAIFINEILYKAVRQSGADERLFDFLFHSIELFDGMKRGVSTFHLHFLLKLTKYLGFHPDISNSTGQYFDLKEGIFTDVLPPHPLVLHSTEANAWAKLLNSNFENLEDLKLTLTEKRALLKALVAYYQLHVDEFTDIKSLQILEDVLN